MKPTYFRERLAEPPLPHISPVAQEMRLPDLRNRILRGLFYIASLLAIVAYIVNLPTIIQGRHILTLVLYSGMLLGLLVLTFTPSIPYLVRALYFLVIVYGVGLSDLLTDGLYGSGRIFLLALPVFTGLLIGLRNRASILAVSIVTLVFTGTLMVSGVIHAPVPNTSTSNSSLEAWIIGAASFAMLAITVTVSLDLLIQGLEKSLLKQSQLAEELELERVHLEQKVAKRTKEIEHRLLQLRTAAEINRTISTILDVNQLLPRVCSLVGQRFDLYYVGIFLVEETDSGEKPSWQPNPPVTRYAVLAAGTGEAGQKMLSEGHRLLVGGDSMIGWCTAQKQARIALDVGQEAVRFDNPHLPDTRSELALPILSQNTVLGAMTVQSTEPSAFDQDDITVLQSIADSLASAIENARLFQEVQTNLEEIKSLHHQYLERSWRRVTAGKEKLDYKFENETSPAVSQLRSIQLPIQLRDQTIGNIHLEAPASRPQAGSEWNPEELALIDAVTTQAALALENARLLDETQQRAAQEELLNQIMAKSQTSLNIETVMKTIIQEIGKTINVSRIAIRLDAHASNSKMDYLPKTDRLPALTPAMDDHSGNGSSKLVKR